MSSLPTVAVIIVNYNGKEHLKSCFGSLQQLNYPQDKIEIICVDNNSSDGSIKFIKNNFPHVHCIEAETNLGFAKGCNVGAHQTHSDYLAFLNNDAKVHTDWLLALVNALQQDQEVVCAAAKILDWDGQTIDFVEGHLNFYGFARQVACQTEVESGFFDQQKLILFASGGAMLINRQVFIEVGGFDEDYFMFFEDVDLGWRLWLLGYKVIFVPEAITYHRFHSSAKKVARFQKNFLYERNALATIIKNYEQANLNKILPAALFLSMHRTMNYLETSNITPESLHPDNWFGLLDRKLNQTVSIGQLTPLIAAQDIVANMPNLIKKRQVIQSKRNRPDQEIVRLFGQPLRIHSLVPHATYSLAQDNLMEAFQIREIFQGVGKRILLLAKTGLPMFGFSSTPAGLRAEAIGKGLEAEGHEVLYSIPASAIQGHPVPNRFKRLAWTEEILEHITLHTAPDVMVVCHWQMLEFIRLGAYRPLVLDHYAVDTVPTGIDFPSTRKKKFLINVDLFTCPSENQQETLRLWLKREGMTVNPENIRVVPAIFAPDGSVQGIETLALFCQYPSMKKDKLKITHTSLLNLSIKVWQVLQENGWDGLKKNVRQYITWRAKQKIRMR